MQKLFERVADKFKFWGDRNLSNGSDLLPKSCHISLIVKYSSVISFLQVRFVVKYFKISEVKKWIKKNVFKKNIPVNS